MICVHLSPVLVSERPNTSWLFVHSLLTPFLIASVLVISRILTLAPFTFSASLHLPHNLRPPAFRSPAGGAGALLAPAGSHGDQAGALYVRASCPAPCSPFLVRLECRDSHHLPSGLQRHLLNRFPPCHSLSLVCPSYCCQSFISQGTILNLLFSLKKLHDVPDLSQHSLLFRLLPHQPLYFPFLFPRLGPSRTFYGRQASLPSDFERVSTFAQNPSLFLSTCRTLVCSLGLP